MKTILPGRPSALLFAAALPFLACAAETAPEGVVARSTLGDTTAAELDAYILALPPARRQPAEDQDPADWRREILEEMLVSRRLSEEAAEQNLLATDEGQAFVENLWEPLLENRVRERRIAETVEVTEEELRQFYDTHPDEFGHGPQIRLRHIFKRATRDATPEERAAKRREIDAIYEQLKGGGNFLELARNQSDSETAPLEGLIGRLDPGALGPQVDTIVWALDEGEISEVVSTPVGFHIFRVDNRIPPFKMEFAEAQSRLQRRFQREKTEASLESYFDELVEASGAVWNPAGLEADDATVLFALGDVELTRGAFLDRLFALPFADQRAASLAESLKQAATRVLYSWEAERLGLGAEPDLAAQREQIEKAALVELGYRNRRRDYLADLDDAELERYYDENIERFRSPQLLRVRLLLRYFEGEEGPEWFRLYEDLERIAEGVRAGTLDFEAEAARLSEDITASRGGDTGWIRTGALSQWAGPRASKAVFDLPLGEVSDPILVEKYDDNRMLYDRLGYMLVRPEELRGSDDRPFEEVRDLVAERFVEQGSDTLQKEIGRQVLQEIDATIFQGRL